VLKIVSRIRVHTRRARVRRTVVVRRDLPRFTPGALEAAASSGQRSGLAALTKSLPSDMEATLSHGEPQTLDLTPLMLREMKKEKKAEEKAAKGGGVGGSNSIVVCRICGMTGDHWTLRCPYKDKAGLDVAKPDGMGASEKDTGDGRYIAPHLRGGASREGSGWQERDDSTTLRVTNLSSGADEDEIRDMFRQFGAVSRCAVPRYPSGDAKGFAFVTYYNKRDAGAALEALNGVGYDHLILSVEWAKPAPPRPGGN
jgi:translation initiation factor 3 subunit G